MPDQARTRVSLERFRYPPEFPGLPRVIRIQEADNAAPGGGQPRVKSGGLSAVGFIDIAELSAVFFYFFPGVIGGAVVHDQYFIFFAREILGKHAFNRFRNKSRVIISVYQYRDKRVCGHKSMSAQ